jgi:hypothetical protein
MLRLLLKCAAFALPLMMAFGALDWRLARMPNGYSEKRRLLEAEAKAVEIVVTGSSRELFAVVPSELPCRTLNLAGQSQSLAIDTTIVNEYLPRMAALQVLVLPVSAFSLDYRLSDSPEDWRLTFFLRAFGFDAPGERSLGLIQHSLIWAYGPKESLAFARHGFKGSPLNLADRGWVASFSYAPISSEAGRARAKFHLSLMNPSFRERNLAALDATIRAARRAGVRVVLLVSPALKTYLDGFPPETLPSMRAAIRGLAERTGAVVADYLEDPRFSTADFSDNDHLSPQGARRFSRLLGTEVLGPLVTCPAAELRATP